MKRLIGGLFAAFALLIGATIYISYRSWDGLVDRRYSETAGVLRGAMADRRSSSRSPHGRR